MMITIRYDFVSNKFTMDTDGLGPQSLALSAVAVVNGMVTAARVTHGEDAAEAVLTAIRNHDDAGAFFAAVKGGNEDVLDRA